MMGREILSWLPMFSNTRERWGQAAVCERNLFVVSVSHLAQSCGTSSVRLRPFLILPLSQCDSINCAWENANTCDFKHEYSTGRVSLFLFSSPMSLDVSCSGHRECQSPLSHGSPHQGSLTGDSAQKGSFFSNLPFKQ